MRLGLRDSPLGPGMAATCCLAQMHIRKAQSSTAEQQFGSETLESPLECILCCPPNLSPSGRSPPPSKAKPLLKDQTQSRLSTPSPCDQISPLPTSGTL